MLTEGKAARDLSHYSRPHASKETNSGLTLWAAAYNSMRLAFKMAAVSVRSLLRLGAIAGPRVLLKSMYSRQPVLTVIFWSILALSGVFSRVVSFVLQKYFADLFLSPGT